MFKNGKTSNTNIDIAMGSQYMFFSLASEHKRMLNSSRLCIEDLVMMFIPSF